MAASDKIIRAVLDRAEPALARLGIMAAPVRDLYGARRAVTIRRPLDEVARFLTDPAVGQTMFRPGGAAPPVPAAPGGTGPRLTWRLNRGGRAELFLSDGPSGSTELVLDVRLDSVAGGGAGRPRYADTAAPVAARAAYRARALIESGEAPSLAANPAGRPEPDPYDA